MRRVRELDLGVHKVERADGSIWVARVFPADRSIDAVRGDAALLDWLVKEGIPAERTAAPDPVSSYGGQAVLVTEFAPGRRPAAGPALFCSSANFWHVSMASPPRTPRRTDPAAPGTTSCSMPLLSRSSQLHGNCSITPVTASLVAMGPTTTCFAKR